MTGYKKVPFLLDLKEKEKRHPLDKAEKVRVLVKNGVVLEEPEVITNAAEVSIANRLRREARPSELVVAPAMIEMGFEHSVPMFGYYLDFYHRRFKVCVEIDGAVHRNRKGRDKRRDQSLRGYGIETHRYWARTVLDNPENFVKHIRNLITLKSSIQSDE